MSPALNGSSMLERFKQSNASEIRNGVMFNFYLGLPHIHIYQHIHTPHDPSPLLHSPTHLSLLHTHHTHTHIHSPTYTHIHTHTPTTHLPTHTHAFHPHPHPHTHTHIITHLPTPHAFDPHPHPPPTRTHTHQPYLLHTHTCTSFLRRLSLLLLSSSGLTFLQ